MDAEFRLIACMVQSGVEKLPGLVHSPPFEKIFWTLSFTAKRFLHPEPS